MAERKREIQVKVLGYTRRKKDDSQENDFIKNRKHGSLSRKMAIDGIIVNTDTTYLEKQFF